MARSCPSLDSMLAELIAIPSVSSTEPALDLSNRPLVERLADWLESAGFAVELLAVPDAPGKFNLVATLGQGDEGLVLAGHTDTVPFDAARWTYDPFRLTESEGRLYGLGMSDMKSFFAFILEAARELDAKALRQPLVVLATADEESSMRGARALAASGRRFGRHALIGEPTNLRPVRLHKGVMGERVRLIGQSGHASDPALGRNAIEGMHALIGNLLEWREELQRQYRHPAFRLPYPTLNLGRIEGGDNANRICGACELHLDLRLLPGLAPETLREELARRVAEVAREHQLEGSVEPIFASIPPAETPAEAPIVRACERLTGHPAEAVNFGTEAPFFNALGMDTLILGPGDIAQAHQPDEYLALERIPPTLELLRALMREFVLA